MQEYLKEYKNLSTSRVVVLDTITQREHFITLVSGQKTEYVLLQPFGDKTLQLTEDITQEVWLLRLLGFMLIGLHCCMFWIASFREKAVVAALHTFRVENLETFKIDDKTPCSKALQAFVSQIQTYCAVQKQLYSGIAHELKTPLAVIKAKCEVTLLKPRESAIYITALQETINHINRAQAGIKALFDLASNKQELKPLNIQDALEEIIRDFTALHPRSKFSSTLHTQDVEIPMQQALLRQIVQNFLQNAFKFTPEDKTIELNSYLNNGILTIEVLDEGSGIIEDKDIFAPFVSGQKEGLGLGLFLAQWAAKALGGRIALKNRTDTQGTIATFWLKIPPKCS